jgi:DNA-binding CsgD family transcriptional regulator
MRVGRDVDWIAGIEAMYAIGLDEEAWLSGIVDALRPGLDAGLGAMAWRYDVRVPEAPVFAPMVAKGGPEWITSGPQLGQQMHGGRFSEMLYLGPPAVASGRAIMAELMGRTDAFDHTFVDLPIRDFFALRSSPTQAVGILVGAGSTKPLRLGPTARARWLRFAAHLGASFRLREGLRREVAVLRGDGRVEHAEGEAKEDRSVRQVLRAAAQRMDRARGRLRRRDAWSAVSIWQALVDGRWSLVDRFDSDGRRYLIAMRNAAPSAALRALSPREAQVVALASRGLSSKLVGYHLGITESTAGTMLARALRKLGAKRTDLPLLATLGLDASGD